MKKIKIISAFVMLFAAIGLTSCDDAPEIGPSSNNNGNGPADFRVNFSEALYVATSTTATVGNGMITITGVRGNSGEAITMTLEGNNLGTYTDVSMAYIVGAGSDLEYININPETDEVWGQIKITGVNTSKRTISGSFSFRGWNHNTPTAEPIAFFNGRFENVPYTGDALPDPVPEPEPGVEYYKAKIGGTLVEFISIQALPLGDVLALVGATPSKSIDIRVNADIEPGTYDITDDIETGITAIHLDAEAENGYEGIDGTLVIISNADGWIKGTFSFTGIDIDDNTIEITEGEFNIEL